MSFEDFTLLIRNLILDSRVEWKAISGPPDHPEAKAFMGTIAQWRFLVIGAPPGEVGCVAIGGTALNLMSGEAFVLTLELAKLAHNRAVASST
jgi:hypothetical protein